ncbi:MAG: pyridoxal-phosphate dependent enzyme [Ardenticatenaceae bacterium]
MNTLFSTVHCLECGHEMARDLYLSSCGRCDSPWLDARYDLADLPADWTTQVSLRPTNIWRYRELLPFPPSIGDISMGEGWTPLTPAIRLAKELNHSEIWIKDERQQPTGSFKDRQAAATVRALKARGIDELVLASTGNAAAAYAAFCARADIKLWVFLTSSVPAEKMRELALYGAEVIKITGTYDQAKKIAADFAKRRGIQADRGAKAIPGKESMKTMAFEIAEQLGWQAPDWYVQAVSGGIGPLGVLKGFTELYKAGIIDRIPKLGIVQSAGCAPMVHAWEQGLNQAEPVQPDTLITVLATGDPGLGYTILKEGIDQYGGAMVSVDDGEAFRAMRRIARTEGFSVEPATSVAFAGLNKLVEQGYIQPHERVVVNCSGHTFSAEKHALEDRYVLHLETEMQSAATNQSKGSRSFVGASSEGLGAALKQLDEQITTIAIIDDNPHDSRLIRRLLQSHKNYRVFEAHNGPDGIDLVRQRQPDLVILDLTLPNMDGFTILAALKGNERTKNIPVMIISAKSLTPSELAQLRRQTDSIWQKGNFRPRDLLHHVVDRLGGEVDHPDMPITTTPRKIVEAALSSEAVGKESMKWANTSERPPEAPRILVVDDNILDARLMRRLFEARQRFKVIEAHSTLQALAAIEKATPDLIVLDLLLPDGKGEQLLKTLRNRKDSRDIPVIVVSAKTIDPALRSYLAQEADSIWEKGIMDRNSLLAHVENMLRN